MTENTDSGNLFEWLKGKKTYLLVIAAFIYGGGIQIGLWSHYPFLDVLLAGGTAASLRAGIAKAQVTKVLVAALLVIGCSVTLPGCGGRPVLKESPVAVVGADFVHDAAAAMQAYADYKAGNVSLTWALQQMFNAYADTTKSSADVQALMKSWTGNSGDAQTLQSRLARIFASSSKSPQTKMQALAQIATDIATNTSP